MKFRCTLVVELEIPDATNEEDAMNIFLGVAGTAIATSSLFPQEGIVMVEGEAKKL